MQSRWAGSSVLIILAACAGETDLAGPEGARGDGHGPSACAEGEFAAWLDGYVDDLRDLGFPLSEEGLAEAEGLADSAPCRGGDDAYLVWAQTWTQAWRPHKEAYEERIAEFRNAAPAGQDYDALVADLAIAPEDERTLRGFLAAAPEWAGPGGYEAWLSIYEDMYRAGFAGLPEGSTGFHEGPGEFNAADDQHLELLRAARPEVSEEGAFAVWFESYEHYYDMATRSSSDPGIDEREAGFLERLEAVRPASAGERDYLVWFQRYVDEFERAAQSVTGIELIESHEDAYLAELEAVLFDEGGGPRAYGAWFQHFTELLSDAADTGTDASPEEADALSRFLSVVPCGASEENRAAHADLVERSAELGELAEYIELAEPEACP